MIKINFPYRHRLIPKKKREEIKQKIDKINNMLRKGGVRSFKETVTDFIMNMTEEEMNFPTTELLKTFENVVIKTANDIASEETRPQHD